MGKFKYKKYLGQNFLHNTAKLNQMGDIICSNREDIIIEIGPGTGALTQYLIKKAKKVIAVEIDKEAISKLNEKFKGINNFEIINCDFLKFDLKEKIKDLKQKVKVAGNIPYYITGPIIEKIIQNREYIEKAYLTVQKEVAERIVAKEGSKIYGSLSVFCQFYADVKILLKIDRKSFFPVPDVDSSFIEFDFNKKEKIKVYDESLFFKIINCAFAHRRKMFINNFKNTFDLSSQDADIFLNQARINNKSRAEHISILKFAQLSNILYNSGIK